MKLNYLVLPVGVLLCAQVAFSAKETTCQTAACKKVSDDLLHHSINDQFQPCDSFYDYVCGKWPASHPLDNGEPVNYFSLRRALVSQEIDEAFLKALNSKHETIQAVAQFYSDCLDTATIEKLGMTPLIESVERLFGAWPMVRRPKTTNGQPKRWQDLFISIFSQTGISPVFDMKSYYNSTNKKYILNIQSGPITNHYHHKFPANESLEKYRNVIHQIATQLLGSADSQQLAHDIEAVLHLEEKLDAASKHSKKVHDFHGSVGELDIATFHRVDWLSVLNPILLKIHSKAAQLTSTDVVHARVVTFLSEAAQILNTTPVEVIQNWLGLMVTFQMGTLGTPEKLQKALLEFMGGRFDPAITKNICNSMPFHWPMVMGRIYIDHYFPAEKKKEAEILVSNIKAVFRDNLQHNDWLDAKTRGFALEKLEAMGQMVGYAESIISDDTLKKAYPFLNNQTIHKGKFFESQFILRVDVRRANLDNLLNIKSNFSGIVDNPTTVNAFYSPHENSISIPAGILQSPFFNHERPFSMNYGSIGSIISHEFTHGFDSNGRRFDKNGQLVNWWTNETLAEFKNRAKCFEEQYSAIHDKLSGLQLNGTRLLAENLADNNGVKTGFLAYKAHQAKFGESPLLPNLNLTSDQLFFVSYAHINCENTTPEDRKASIRMDSHSPNRYRVNVVLGNTPQFASAFNCRLGDKMNPKHKCTLW